MNEFTLGEGYLEDSLYYMMEDKVKETEADIVSLLITKGELNAAWIVAKSSGFTRAGFDNLVDIWVYDRYNMPADNSDVAILQNEEKQ
jgi:hypothetical protein